MSDSPTTNPDFYSWNKAYFKYCDGASFSGDAKGLVGNTTLFYQCHAILHALLDALNARGLQSASQVLVSGWYVLLNLFHFSICFISHSHFFFICKFCWRLGYILAS